MSTVPELFIGGRFRLGQKIGAGTFGDVYHGTDVETGDEVAIKLESAKSAHPRLHYESRLCKRLGKRTGIPALHWYGVEGDCHAMVMTLLGPSLEELFIRCGRIFSLKTTLMLASQMIDRVEYLHSRGIIHRDIKPDNFLVMPDDEPGPLYIIDFGLSKRYQDKNTHRHIPFREGKSLMGTARYASVSTHNGLEQSRRDDLETVGYLLVYFLRGSLPWQEIGADTKEEKYRKIRDAKVSTPVETLCEGLPSEFATYISYCRGLGFEECPDYAYLQRLLRQLLVREGFRNDGLFDWNARPLHPEHGLDCKPRRLEEGRLAVAAVAA